MSDALSVIATILPSEKSLQPLECVLELEAKMPDFIALRRIPVQK